MPYGTLGEYRRVPECAQSCVILPGTSSKGLRGSGRTPPVTALPTSNALPPGHTLPTPTRASKQTPAHAHNRARTHSGTHTQAHILTHTLTTKARTHRSTRTRLPARTRKHVNAQARPHARQPPTHARVRTRRGLLKNVTNGRARGCALSFCLFVSFRS